MGDRILLFSNAHTWIRNPSEPLDDMTGQVHAISQDFPTGVGPGLEFANILATVLPEEIVLVPCARGPSSAENWEPSYSTNTLYGSCLTRLLTATASTGGFVGGILYYQGESDAGDLVAMENWAERTIILAEQFRMDLDNRCLPFLYVQLPPTEPNVSYMSLWGGFRDVQTLVLFASFHNIMVHAPDGPRLSDTVHLATAAQFELGKQLAFAWLGSRFNQALQGYLWNTHW